MIDVEICSGGTLNDCNDQLIKWLVSFGVLDMIGTEGEASALEQYTQSPFIIHGVTHTNQGNKHATMMSA